jgi:hypothetical protein
MLNCFKMVSVIFFGVFLQGVVAAPVSVPFDLEKDGLCFKNADPDLVNAAPWPLGKIGVKRGICQGIAGTAGAFMQNAEFAPDQSRPQSVGEAHQIIKRVIRHYKYHQSDKVTVPGYENLNSFCRDYRRLFLREAAILNLNIAVKEILPVMVSFKKYKDKPLLNEKSRARLMRVLQSLEDGLHQGRPPLLMYYSHVVLLLGYSVVETGGVPSFIRLDVYDSNFGALRTKYVPIDETGEPSASSTMLWNITP